MVGLGRHNYAKNYLCTICCIAVPKLNKLGEPNSRICPECREPMRGKSHNPRRRRREELLGLVKRY